MAEQRIRDRACALVAAAGLLAGGARAEDAAPERSSAALGWAVAAYLPNRLFDLCDVVRLRARVGSGLAAGARATRYAPFFVGDFRALWLGLPGPRGRAKLPLPAGSEGQSGVEVGPARVGSASSAPEYGVGEIGAGLMLYFVGADAGVDLYELADFLAGFALIDFARDDF